MTAKHSFQFGNKDYEILQRDLLYEGIFRLVRLHIRHRLYNGGWSEIFTREVLERRSAAAVLPYDPKTDRVILIEQFRPGALASLSTPWQIEIPAGVFGFGEIPEAVATREAEEEAGCIVSDLKLIADFFVSPGGSDEYLYIYCGRMDSSGVNGVHGLVDEHEDIRVLNLSVDEAVGKLNNQEIKTVPAILALQWLVLNRDELRKEWV